MSWQRISLQKMCTFFVCWFHAWFMLLFSFCAWFYNLVCLPRSFPSLLPDRSFVRSLRLVSHVIRSASSPPFYVISSHLNSVKSAVTTFSNTSNAFGTASAVVGGGGAAGSAISAVNGVKVDDSMKQMILEEEKAVLEQHKVNRAGVCILYRYLYFADDKILSERFRYFHLLPPLNFPNFYSFWWLIASTVLRLKF